MGYDNTKFYQSLRALDVLDEQKLLGALQESIQQQLPLDAVILDKDLLKPEVLGTLLADFLQVPYVNLVDKAISPSVLSLIPESVAIANRCVAFHEDEHEVSLALEDPRQTELVVFMGKKTGKKVKVYLGLSRHITQVLSRYHSDVTQEMYALLHKHEGKEAPIIALVEMLLSYAHSAHASDVHIEPGQQGSLVRYRIDGILHDAVVLPTGYHDQVVTRIKVLSQLRTDEHQEAQDGKFSLMIKEERLAIRVSIAPITKGEKVVMRLLAENSRQFSLVELGLSAADMDILQKAYSKPHGMILATGPTGSGKTTTLYAILKLLNSRTINIMTIEDPVEYNLENVNQIQVNEQTGVTFAHGLRSIVRQDPDVILVGEIRDAETAGIAVNSAMTGHIVLSTLHTNDAATAFPRLLDLDVEAYLVASTVEIVVAQRLVRTICSQCKVSIDTVVEKLDESVLPYLPKGEPTIKTYMGKGCSACGNTGYVGRIGIFEVLQMSDPIREAIAQKQSASTIHALAVKAGMRTMLMDGVGKVLQGVTTVEEVLRVTKE